MNFAAKNEVELEMVMTYKEISFRVIGWYTGSIIISYTVLQSLLSIILGAHGQLEIALPAAIFSAAAIAFYRSRFHSANIEVHDKYIIGPSKRGLIGWGRRTVKVYWNELADNGLSNANSLFGIYQVKSKNGDVIQFVNHFYDKALLQKLKDKCLISCLNKV
jgi:hypothetical protein